MTKHSKNDVEAAFAEAVKEDRLCSLGRILAESDPEVRKVIESKVEDTLHYSSATIARVLKGLDFPPVSAEMVTKHRRSACRCQ